jgi:hypothetical protein
MVQYKKVKGSWLHEGQTIKLGGRLLEIGRIAYTPHGGKLRHTATVYDSTGSPRMLDIDPGGDYMLRLDPQKLDRETLVSLLGEGFHTAFRKAVDSEEAWEVWQMIKKMPGEDWAAILKFVADGLTSYGEWHLERHPGAEAAK